MLKEEGGGAIFGGGRVEQLGPNVGEVVRLAYEVWGIVDGEAPYVVEEAWALGTWDTGVVGRIAVDCEFLLKAETPRHESREVSQSDVFHIHQKTMEPCHAVCASA